ncbi:hypothetical protein BGY98DRAFT_930047 [Russula aff. rugulosa BPL654]|nr:hypothetical protein BGY98DRAFT_930047 [Russula aff. rugulosa BPL654]
MSHVTGKRPISLWNAFLASRFQRAALRDAWGTLALGDPHTSSLAHYENMLWSLVDSQSFENTDKPVSFTRAFTYQLYSLGLLDQTFAVRIDLSLSSASPSRLQTEAREAGVDFGKFSSDLNANDTQTLLQRIYSDPISHATFAEMVLKVCLREKFHHQRAKFSCKRFHTASSSLDVETLGHVSRILSANDAALDLVSLHVELSTLVSSALAFVEEYDCEAVGDPKVLSATLLAITRFKITDTLRHKNRPLDINYLRRADAFLMPSAPTPEAKAFKTWFKALFDKNSEGIEDGVIRSTRPKTLLAIAATVFLQALRAAGERKLEPETLNNGITFQSPQHLHVLRTIMLSPNLPRPVLTLCGPSVVRLLSEWRGGTQPFDVPALRQEVIKATGMPVSEPILNSPSPSSADQSRKAVQDALVLLQSGKPPFLNVAACLAETPAIEFLQTFWLALDMPIKTDATADAAKRLAVFILATPRASPTPPLLPIFLHNLLPSLIDKFDNPNLGQAVTGDLDLLIAIVSSSLMAALQLERALYTASGEQVFMLGSSSSAMASRLALGLRHRKSSSKGKLIAQRLTSSQTFVANFPVFKTEI